MEIGGGGCRPTITTRILAEELDTSKSTMCQILTENLVKRNICARFEWYEDQASKNERSSGVFEYFIFSQ